MTARTATVTAPHQVQPRVVVHAPGAEERRRVASALYRSGMVCEPVGEGPPEGAVLGVCWITGDDEGLGRVRELRGRMGTTPIVAVLAGRRRRSFLRKALRAGADGMVLEDEVELVLAATVDAVLLGSIVVPSELMRSLVGEALTFRERQILGMVVLGFTNRQIADKLFLAESTVKTHLSSAFAKLGVRSRAEATALILDPEEGVGLGVLGVPGGAGGDPGLPDRPAVLTRP